MVLNQDGYQVVRRDGKEVVLEITPLEQVFGGG